MQHSSKRIEVIGSCVDLTALVADRPVPSLPTGATALFQTLSDNTLAFDEITEALRKHPTIVARLLALANSPWSSPAAPIVALDDAVSRLGLGVVRSVSIALTVSRPFIVSRSRVFDLKRFWCSALMAADGAARLAARASGPDTVTPTIARTAGLISNLGLLWLADAIPDAVDRALSATAEDPSLSVDAALLDQCGIGSSDAGAALADVWQLPPQLGAAMSYRRPGSHGAEAKACADLIRLVNDLVTEVYAEAGRRKPVAVLKACGLRLDDYASTHDALESALPEFLELAGTLFSGSA